MKYKLLGHSGLRVSEICLGAMTFGDEWKDWGLAAPKEECRKIFDAFAEKDGNFIDTANNYNGGASEKYVGEFIASDRAHFVLATKYVSNMRRGDPNASGSHRKNLVQALEASLKRLGTDYIDLYWVHVWDFFTPIEEVMRALDDMVRAGKILYVGVSDAPAWVVSRANTMAELKAWTPFVGLQVEYSLVQRTPERELLPMASALDIGVTAWSPLGGGVLTGKYANGSKSSDPKRMSGESEFDKILLSERNLRIALDVKKIADELGRAPSQVAVNWVRQRPGVVIPIIGARKTAQIKENMACLDFELAPAQIERLNAVSKIDMGFPHDFMNTATVQEVVYGGTLASIQRHSL